MRAKYGDPNLIGVPFYAEGFYAPNNKADKRPMYEIGWTEANLVQIMNPEHIWFDPTGRISPSSPCPHGLDQPGLPGQGRRIA